LLVFSISYKGHFIGNMYKNGSNGKPIWLDDVECTGRERDARQCRHRAWGIHNCDHSEDVSISCLLDPSTIYAGTNSIPAYRVLCSAAISLFGIGHVSKLNCVLATYVDNVFKCNVTHMNVKQVTSLT